MTLNELFLEYDLKRSRSALTAAHNKEALLRKYPALGGLLSEKEDICLQQVKDSLFRPKDREAIAADAREKLAQVNETIAGLISPEELASMEPVYECDICKDTGYDDRRRRKLCTCMVKRIYADLYGAVPTEELTGSFSEYREEIFKNPAQQRQAKALRAFSEKYAETAPKPLLIFMGTAGLGKSFTMSCIAKEMAKTRETVLFISAFSLFHVFHQSRLGSEIPLDPIFEADVLLIDDLGTEPMTANVTQEYLFRLLEHRIRKNLPTIFSTNMNSTQLKDRYTEKVTSRLFAETHASVLRLAGDDVRLK